MELKGGVVEEYIPEGFFGSWAVISKLESSNNPMYFNYESRDIWTLSGYDNVLILENLQSGAWGKIIVKENICNKNPPSDAFGNNKFKIGLANTIIPNVQGSPIIIVINNDKDILLLAVLLSPFAINPETEGTNAVANAILKESGNVANVSTLPDKIPYCAFAITSGKNVFNPFTTVTISTIFDNVDIIALNVIGIETIKIFHSLLCDN